MIFRTSVSEDKHFALQSSSTHNDDSTLLEDQQRNLESQPSLTGKYVNKTARSWVEARVDWRLQWFGATLIYLVVVVVAYFASYRHQYNSIIITTLKQNPAIMQGPRLPQILLVAEYSPFPPANFTISHLGVASDLYSAQNGNLSLCNVSANQGPSDALPAILVPLNSCTLNSSSDNIVMMLNFSESGPPPELMIGVFPPEQPAQEVFSTLSSPRPQYLSYLATFGDARVSITPTILISLKGPPNSSYGLGIQRIPKPPPDDSFPYTASNTVKNGGTVSLHPSNLPKNSLSSTTDPGGSDRTSTTSLNAGGTTSSGLGLTSSTSSSPNSSGPPYTTMSPTPTLTSRSPGDLHHGGPWGDPNDPNHDHHPGQGPKGGGGGHRRDHEDRGDPSPQPPRPLRRHLGHRRRPPGRPDMNRMNVLIEYKYLDQTVQSETRRMTRGDIVVNCFYLLSVLLLSAEIIGLVGSWWIRRRMSKRFHLD